MKFRIVIRRFLSGRGASLVEYAVLLGLIALVCIMAVRNTGQRAGCKLADIATGLGSDSIALSVYATSCSGRAPP